MASSNRKQVKVKIANARASFVHVHEPQEMTDDDGKKSKSYSAHLLLGKDHPQFNEIRRAMLQVANETYGKNGKKILQALMKAGKVCFRPGSSKTDNDGNIMEGYEDVYFLSTRSQVQPTILGRDKKPLNASSGKPYSGCYVNAIVSIWGQTGKFGKRINAQLQGIQFLKDGDPFSSGRAASVDEFDDLADEFSDDDDSIVDDDLDFGDDDEDSLV